MQPDPKAFGLKPIVMEVHPDWGSDIAYFKILNASNTQLGKWYEVGSTADQGDWNAGSLYATIAIGPTVSGSTVDFVLDLSNASVDGKNTPAPTTAEFTQPTVWSKWSSGATTLKVNVPADAGQAYRVYAATNAGSSWSKTGALLGVMAVVASGDLYWWKATTSAGATLPLSSMSIIGGTTALYFETSTSVSETCASGDAWYEAVDTTV